MLPYDPESAVALTPSDRFHPARDALPHSAVCHPSSPTVYHRSL